MKFMCLIYQAPNAFSSRPSEDQERIRAGHGVFSQEQAQRGALVDGAALHPASEARTVRTNGGKALISDGPYTETKEVIAGYYVLAAGNADEAVKLAERIAGISNHCAVEVRQLLEM